MSVKYKILWSDQAEKDRDSIVRFIAKDNLDAALAIDDLFTQSSCKLLNFPLLGHKGRIINTYELVIHTHYILVYQLIQDRIEIVTILHSSRMFP